MFTRWEPDHGETLVFAMVGSGSNNGVSLFFAKTVFGGGAISAGRECSHPRGLSALGTWWSTMRHSVTFVSYALVIAYRVTA